MNCRFIYLPYLCFKIKTSRDVEYFGENPLKKERCDVPIKL